MARPSISTNQIQRVVLSTLLVGAALALLIYGKGFLIPIVLAALLASLLTNVIIQLEKLGWPSWLATTCSLAIGVVVLVVFGLILQSQAGALQSAWPQYMQRIERLSSDLTALIGTDGAERIKTTVSNYDFGQLVGKLGSAASGVFGDIILILIYTGFLLAERGTLKTKLDLLVPGEKDNRELTEVLGSVGQGIRRYLAIKTTVSALTGLLTFLLLKLFGAQFAELSGLLAFLLNFIPVIGSAFAVIIPVVLALMQFDTIVSVVQIAVLLMGVQFLVGNIIEPKLMGRTLNLSPFVVVVSLTLWTSLWGVVGALLSVPITAAAVIICRNIQNLRWIAILLSVDGKPEVTEEETSPKLKISLPFLKSDVDAEEVQLLRAELDALKSEKSKVTRKQRTTASKKSGRQSRARQR